MPSIKELKRRGALVLDIEQVYLISTGEARRRVRKVTNSDGKAEYYYTEKSGQGLVRKEIERKISEREWKVLLVESDSSRLPIRKIRYQVPFRSYKLEIDIFEDFGFNLLEIELQSTKDVPSLPKWLDVDKEVTEDPSYTNSQLALQLAIDRS